MNSQRLLHLAAFLFMTIPLIWIVGCPSGGDNGSGTINPPLNETSIWTGAITTTAGNINPPEVDDLAMILYMQEGADEGRAMGLHLKERLPSAQITFCLTEVAKMFVT